MIFKSVFNLSVLFLFMLTIEGGELDVRTGKDFAVFFAIDNYDDFVDLKNPISDVNTIARELRNNYGFQTEVVTNPNRTTIYKTIEKYHSKNYAEDGQLLIFFSGHGAFVESTQEGFFVPADGKQNDSYQLSYVSHTRLERSINEIPCKHILLAIDASYTDTFGENIVLRKGDERPGTKLNDQSLFINQSLKYQSRLFVTSGGIESTADNSQFAKQFISALRRNGEPDGILTFEELLANLQRAKQLPTSGQFGEHEVGGNFLFIKDKKDNISTQKGGPIDGISEGRTGDFFTDPRDGLAYRIKTITRPISMGVVVSHTWMIDNLRYDMEGSFFHQDLKSQKDQNKYGRLYTWSAAKKACPPGWHLPTDVEWQRLIHQFAEGGLTSSGPIESYKELVEGGSSGFAVLLGGLCDSNDNCFEFSSSGGYWSATENGVDLVWNYSFGKSTGKIYRETRRNTNALSCRCIKD